MNLNAHMTRPALADIAMATWKRYLPFLACFGCVSLVLYVVSGLHFN